MNDEELPSLFSKIAGSLLFSLSAIFSLIWFFVTIIALMSELIEAQAIITFSKGAMYLLGAGISASFFSIGVIYHSIYSRKVSEKIESMLLKGALIGVLIMLGLPQIAHFSINKFMEKRLYVTCEEAAHRWLIYKKYVYTKNQNVCSQLIKEK